MKANIPTSSLCGNTPFWESYNIQENVLGNLHQNVFANAKDKVSGSLSLQFCRKLIIQLSLGKFYLKFPPPPLTFSEIKQAMFVVVLKMILLKD